jgi:hypothetical protein
VGQFPEHIYENPGVYEVILTITDDDGRTGSSTVLIQVLEATCDPASDSDGDGIGDCEDLCLNLAGDPDNMGCPIFETLCDQDCGCPQ